MPNRRDLDVLSVRTIYERRGGATGVRREARKPMQRGGHGKEEVVVEP
jgi:hypothetical protein